MYSPSENRENAGATSKDFEQVRPTRSRTKITTKEDMLGDATVKSTQITKLLDYVNGPQKLDLIGVKKECDAFMNRCELGPMRESEDGYFSPITSPTQARPNDDYYKGKYRQLQKEQEQYQATEASLNTEIERLKMELERKKDDIEHMKAEKQENYKSQDTSSQTQARPNDDYYKGNYRQLQKEQEQYQATNASLNTEIERLRIELERKKDEIEYIKAEKQENYKSQDTSRDAQTITILQRENDEMKRKVEETEKTSKQREDEHIKWIEAMDKMTTDIAKYENALTKSLQKEEEYKKRLKEEEWKTKDAEETKLLSKEMGTKLNDNNPAIADLSDPNRATKLAEMYSEIYDNEWTDALEELDTNGYTEEICVRKLLDIVKKADAFCKEKAENQMRAIEDSFFMSNTDEDKGSCQNKKTIMKMVKDHRKSTAEKNAEKIYKEFSNRYEPKYRMETEFAKKIVKLCWLMAVQDPPVCLGREAKSYDKLDTDIFRPYTQTGTMVSYTVWLPMFLHEGGPLLSKGVAQPVSFRAKSAPTSRTNVHRNDKTEVKSRLTTERSTAAENRIPQTKHDWESLSETRRNQNYKMDFKHQITTKKDVVKIYAPQPNVAWEPTHGYHNNKYHDQYHNPLSGSNYKYDTNRSQFNTGVVTNAHTSYGSPSITYTKTQYEQSTVPTKTYGSDVHHKNFSQWR